MRPLGEDDLIYLSTHLCYVSYMSLRLTCKSFSTLPLPSFQSLFIQKLRECGIPNPEAFNDKLIETGSVVSGSFILDILYNTDHHSDIDVYEKASEKRTGWCCDYIFDPSICLFTQLL